MRNSTLAKPLAVLFAAVLMLLLAAGARAQTTAAEAPDALIKTLTADVLDSIRSDPSLQAGDVSKLNQLVDSKILPHVNFEKMTRLAVGRGWREATPEQRQALTREFRALLVRTYAGAVAQIKDHQVQMRPFRAAPGDTDVLVRSQVAASRGEPIQLDYRLEKEEKGWKIYDVNVAGVWLVENYKSIFASEISKNGVDGLVKMLTERNKSLEAKKA
jgi:phospholipid transport system substrate-binding protein